MSESSSGRALAPQAPAPQAGPLALPVLPTLPCYPCPHQSACCDYGVSLVADEPDILRREYGDASLTWDEEENEWRTSVVDGKCFFLKQNACSIHGKSYYPRICRGFPTIDGETGGEYLYDKTICPEFGQSSHE